MKAMLRRNAQKRNNARRVGLLVAAAFVGILAVRSVVDDKPVGVVVASAVWMAALLGGGLAFNRVGDRGRTWVLVATSLASALGMNLVVGMSGGHQSVYVVWLSAIPLGFALLLQEEAWATVGASVGTSVGAVLMLIATEAPTHMVFRWGIGLILVGAAALFGAIASQRTRRALDREQAARLAAVEELAASEARRTQAERLAIVGRLAAGVAHEINNPLAFVISNLNLMLRDRELPPEEQLEVLAESLQGAKRIAAIVSELRTFARGESTGVQPVQVGEACEAALRLASVRLAKGIEVRRELPPELPTVMVNEGRLSQVLVNLVVNSADALENCSSRERWVRVSAAATKDDVRLTIEDNGPGFSDEALSRAFEPFFTTKEQGKGTGLGMALSREYVQSFGGNIRAENRPEGGARVVLTLPLREAPEEPTEEAKPPPSVALERTSSPLATPVKLTG